MKWKGAIASVGLLTILATESFAAEMFTCAKYFAATPAVQKKTEPGVKGTLGFDGNSKKVEFLDSKGRSAFAVNYDAIQRMQYEKTAQPRYLAGVLISPVFLLTRSTKYYLKMEYKDQSGEARSVIIRLNKGNARQTVATARTQTGKSVQQIEQK